MRMFTLCHVFVPERVVLHCPHCNDFPANIFNKNIIAKLQITLFSPSKGLIGKGIAVSYDYESAGQLRDLPYHSPTSRRAQRKIHGA